jgi:iron complex transport system substrate-binding protein
MIVVAAANLNAQQSGFDDYKVIVDDRGVRVKIPSQVNKVVALRPGAVEVIIALGAEDKLVGIDSSTKQGDLYGALNAKLRPELKNLPVVMMGGDVNIEELVLLKPDVVIIGGYSKIDLIDRIERANLTVVVLHFEGLGNFSKDIEAMGKILGKENASEDLAGYIQNIIDFVSSKVSAIPYDSKIRSLFCGFDIFHTYGEAAFENDQIEAAGGVNVAKNLSGYLPLVSSETLLSWDPQIIFMLSNASGSIVFNDSRIKDMAAVKDHRIYSMPEWGWDYGSPRAIFAIEWMAYKMYPDRFQGIDIMKECNDFYQRLYKVNYEGVNLAG